MAQVKLKGLRKSYGSVETIHDVDLVIEDKEFCVLVGPSGCGKSTLLRMIAGLESITAGDLYINEEEMGDIDAAKRGVAMVFQSYALYPHMTVRENVGFGLKMLKRSKAEIDERVRVASQILQLDELLDRKPSQLSGGQRQRVAIGRAIVRNPKVFLFDEPLSNLDAELRASMRVELAKLHHHIGATMIYVTHDQVEAMTMADKIVVLKAGRIEQVGTPLELYERPKNQFVAGFIGSPKMNFVTGELAKSFGAATIGIRPENMSLSTSEGLWKGTVTVVEHLGADTYCHVNSDIAGNLIVRVPGSSPLSHGDTVWVSPQSSRIHKFDQFGAVI